LTNPKRTKNDRWPKAVAYGYLGHVA